MGSEERDERKKSEMKNSMQSWKTDRAGKNNTPKTYPHAPSAQLTKLCVDK